jgi:hypothetical protein
MAKRLRLDAVAVVEVSQTRLEVKLDRMTIR